MPDGKEEDIPLGQNEGLGEEAPPDPDATELVPTDLEYIINTYTDTAMDAAYPPMMSPDDVKKADWFLSFKSDQKSPAGLTHYLMSSYTQVNYPTPRASSLGATPTSEEKIYYSGIAYNNNFMHETDGRTFFHHLWLAINGPWLGENSTTFTPKTMVDLAGDLDDLVTMVNGATEKLNTWRTTADENLKGATADVFVQHLGNLQLRFNALGEQAGGYPEALRDTRNAVVTGAGETIRRAYDKWLESGLWDPLKVIDKWFEDNKSIATLGKGDDTSQIGDIGKANDPNTWKEIQERIKTSWRNNLNTFITDAAEAMKTLGTAYSTNQSDLAEIKPPKALTLDWSGVGGGGGPGGPGPGGGGGENEGPANEEEYNDALEEWYRKQIEYLENNPPGGGGEGEGNGENGPSDAEEEYNNALEEYYRNATDELKNGPEGSGGDLNGDGDGENQGPASEEEYNNALDEYYRNATDELNNGPDGSGGGLGDGDGSGENQGPASENRYNEALDDYYNQAANDLESEGNTGPIGGGGQVGGGGGGNNTPNRRPSEERYNQQLDDYYDQATSDLDREMNAGPDGSGGGLGDGDGTGQPSAEEYEQRLQEYYDEQTGDLDRLMSESPDPDGDGRTGDGEALTPAQQEYQQALDDYYQSQNEDLQQLVSGPEGSGGGLGDGDGSGQSSPEEYQQRIQEYADEERGNLDRLREDVNGITDENGNPAPELEEQRQQLSDYYDQRSQELDDLVENGPGSGGGNLGDGNGSGGDGSSADEYQDRLNEYYDQQTAELEEQMQSGPDGSGGGLGDDGPATGGDGSSADDYQDRLNEYYDQQAAELEEQMNAGPDAGGGGLGDSLGRGNGDGENETAPPPSYSIGNGWENPGSSSGDLVAPNASAERPDANGVTGGGGDLRSNPPAEEADPFSGAVGGNGQGQGGGNFSGVGGGAGAGMGGAGGMPPMMPPMGGMGGMGGGGGQGDQTRTRSTWLSEDERVWGTSAGDRLSVLGRHGPGDTTKGSPNEYVPGANGAGARTSTGGPGEGRPGKRKPGIGNRRGRLQGSGDQREDQR
ncbi:hypothetical protein ACFOVU_07825 [Nocardiopsis sediminis]|uniref:WXG100 family type VII secretion target n=1 Tax=Nocardiopsis sediminis TaxID=1778267 RepID=A0ABV8FL76_9ACTN